MGTPYMSEVKIVAFNFAPKGWALCNGQLMPINQNQALFSLLGTTYGGDGRTTFGLPNLQGCVPIHVGAGFTQGQISGETAHTLQISEMSPHTHPVVADTTMAPQANGNIPTPTSRLAGSFAQSLWGQPSNPTNMNAAAVGNAGNGQPHDNMSPYLVLNMVIALQGVFPSRN